MNAVQSDPANTGIYSPPDRLAELRRRWSNFKALPTKWALRVLVRSMKRDPSYAHSWFCNISMPIYDAVNKGCVEPVMSGQQSGAIADKLMRHLFGVENSDNPHGAITPKPL